MFPHSLFVEHWIITAISWTLIHSLWQISLVGGVWYILQIKLRGESALRHNIGLFSFLIIFIISIGTLTNQLAQNYPVVETPRLTSAVTEPLTESELPLRINTEPHFSEQVQPANNKNNFWALPTTSTKDKHWWYGLLVGCWLLGLLFNIAKYGVELYYLRKLSHYGTTAFRKQDQLMFQRLKTSLGITKTIRFLQSDQVFSPLTFGHFKPVVLLPLGMINGFPPAQIEAILLHELAHIKRHDFLINMLQTWVETLFFYHPVIWWISKEVRQTREELCDDTVVEYLNYSPILTPVGERTLIPPPVVDPRLIYSEALINVQRLFLYNKNNLAMKFQHSEDQLTNRIQRLFDPQLNGRRPKRSINLQLLGLILLIAVGSFAFTELKKQTVSIAADRMNVLYMGVENPITVAVAGVRTEDTKVESDQLRLVDQGDGHYLAIPKKPGEAIIKVEGNGLKEEVRFRVKRIPAPVAQIKNRTGGNISASSFQESKGVTAFLQNFDFDAYCTISQYHLTRVGHQEDPQESINYNAKFNEGSMELVSMAAPGDIYYIDQVMCKCPGDKIDRPINSLVFKIQ